MKERLKLQLFADDTSAAAAAAASAADASTDSDAAKGAATEGDAKPSKAKASASAAKYTDADVDRLIDQKFAEWQKKQQRAVDEAKKLAEMNATQKAEYERDQLQKELDDLKRKDSLAEMTKTARKMLSDSGIAVSDELLAVMVTTDAGETKAAIDGFVKAFNDAVESAVKGRLKGESPRKGSGGGAAAMTKEQIMAIRDPELRQKKMLENKSLFNF